MRLDKYLADIGIGSRNDVKKLIKSRKIIVNNEVITESKFQVSTQDEVYLENEKLEYKKDIYILYHKPKGVVCANYDSMHTTVFDEIAHPQSKQLFTVGRLDKDTTGALLITNDGALDHRLRSLKHHVDKTYDVTLLKDFDESFIPIIENGIVIDNEEVCHPAKVFVKDKRNIILVIQEGKYHQVKRMMKACNNEVIALHRSKFSFLDVHDLDENEFRYLTIEEVGRLKQ